MEEQRALYNAATVIASESRLTAAFGVARSSPTTTSPPPSSASSNASVTLSASRFLLPLPSTANKTQSEPAYCGLASLSMVLNALAIDPGRKWKGPWRWFDESMLDCCESLETVKSKGISLRKLVSLAHCVGAKVEAFHTNHSNIDEFRKYVMKCSSSDDCHVISSYDRSVLKQTGTCHFSPVGGYHAEKDLALILDVARFKYPPHWVPLNILWDAMTNFDESTGQHRGFMLISRPHREPG